MNITFVTESHPFNDDKQTVDVAEQSDLDKANARIDFAKSQIGNLRVTTENNERKINNAAQQVEQNTKWIHGHTDWIRGIETKVKDVEAKVDAMPQALREALDCALKEVLEKKLALFEKLIANLRQEGEKVPSALADLRQEREKVSAELADVRRASERVAAELADVRRLREEMRREVELLQNQQRAMDRVYGARQKILDDQLAEAKRLRQCEDPFLQTAAYKVSVRVPSAKEI